MLDGDVRIIDKFIPQLYLFLRNDKIYDIQNKIDKIFCGGGYHAYVYLG